MADVQRLSAESVRQGVVAGSTLLVCAYDSDEKFASYRLEGAIPLSEFKKRVADLARDTSIVFYCA